MRCLAQGGSKGEEADMEQAQHSIIPTDKEKANLPEVRLL